MKRTMNCRCCNGSGVREVELCDKCNKEGSCGDYKEKRYCQDCWAEELSDEDINNF